MITLLPSKEPNSVQRAMMARKYGMFIHFGINTFYDTEWSDGTLDINGYKPEDIDAESWGKNAYEAGMNYVILITKHHDGFCLWDTKTTDYCVGNSPVKTDVVARVAKACEKYGVKLGLYYSLWDRHEKCYKDDKAYNDYMCAHLNELLGGRYGEICELWLDGAWDKYPKQWDIPRLYELTHSLQENCAMAVNLTIGKSLFKLTGARFRPHRYKQGMPIRYFPSDFRLWDPFFTRADDPKLYSRDSKLYYLPFEATICIRNMRNWFWDPHYTRDRLVGAEFIAEKYRLLTQSGNTLVVNVAPNTAGRQEQEDIDCLMKAAEILGIRRDAGALLRKNV